MLLKQIERESFEYSYCFPVYVRKKVCVRVTLWRIYNKRQREGESLCVREKLGEMLFIEIIKERKRKSNTYTNWERDKEREREERWREREREERWRERERESEER